MWQNGELFMESAPVEVVWVFTDGESAGQWLNALLWGCRHPNHCLYYPQSKGLWRGQQNLAVQQAFGGGLLHMNLIIFKLPFEYWVKRYLFRILNLSKLHCKPTSLFLPNVKSNSSVCHFDQLLVWFAISHNVVMGPSHCFQFTGKGKRSYHKYFTVFETNMNGGLVGSR